MANKRLEGVVTHAKESSKTHQQKVASLGAKLGLSGLVEIGFGIFGSVADITPQMAEDWLATNTNNRRPKERSIKKYSGDMAEGYWRLTHEAVAFGLDGELKDGQNRLKAIVRSNQTVRMMVVVGICDEAKAVIDQNVPRTPLDAARFQGVDVGPNSRTRIGGAKIAYVGMKGQSFSVSNSKTPGIAGRLLCAPGFRLGSS